MKSKAIKILIICACMLITVGTVGQNATDILRKVDEVMFSSKDMTAKNTLIITDRNGKEERREAMIWQKGTNMRLFRFTSPASQAGIAFLSLPNDVMYLYLPAYGRERRIASSAKNQQFAGTDFTYDDLEAGSLLSKYEPSLLESNDNHFVLELRPRKSSEYAKVVVRIHKNHYYPEQMDFYDRGNNKVKQANYSFKRIGNYWSAYEIKMSDLKRGRATVLQLSDIKYDTGLTDDNFSIRKLIQ